MSPPDQKEKMKQIKSNIKQIEERHRQFLQDIQLPMVKTEADQPQSAYFETNFFNNVNKMIPCSSKIYCKNILNYLKVSD
jgi:hypothetical protein